MRDAAFGAVECRIGEAADHFDMVVPPKTCLEVLIPIPSSTFIFER